MIIYGINPRSGPRPPVTVGRAAALRLRRAPRALQKLLLFWSSFYIDALSYKQHRCEGMNVHIWLSVYSQKRQFFMFACSIKKLGSNFFRTIIYVILKYLFILYNFVMYFRVTLISYSLRYLSVL